MEPDYTAQEKAALATWHIAQGKAMQTRDVAELVGLSKPGAWHLMQRLSRVIPIYQDDRGVWMVCSAFEVEYAGIEI